MKKLLVAAALALATATSAFAFETNSNGDPKYDAASLIQNGAIDFSVTASKSLPFATSVAPDFAVNSNGEQKYYATSLPTFSLFGGFIDPAVTASIIAVSPAVPLNQAFNSSGEYRYDTASRINR
jgi:hypothetical protein